MRTHGHSFTDRFLILPAVLWVAFAVSGAAHAQQPTTARGDNKSQQRLTQEVNHELVMLPWYSVFDNLQYKVNGSEVTLQGQVLSDRTKSDAEKNVKSIEGVTKVTNNIELLPASPQDDQIRHAEYRAIFGDPSLQKYSFGSVQPVHIIVKNGHVTLEGVVLNQGDKNLAGIRANGVPGVFSVTNNLRIENSQTEKNNSENTKPDKGKSQG